MPKRDLIDLYYPKFTIIIRTKNFIDYLVCEGRLRGVLVVNFMEGELFLLLFLVRSNRNGSFLLVYSDIYIWRYLT